MNLFTVAETFELPPTGVFQKLNSNPVIPATGIGYIAENIVFDTVTNKYWTPFTNCVDLSLGIARSSDLLTWTVDQTVLIAGTDLVASPHLLLYAGVWHMYYAKVVSGVTKIFHATCATVNGTYFEDATPTLLPTTGWESSRVMEPYVFRDDDGRWIMFYMGDSGGATEQVGYATATSPYGPWTRYAGNPVIAFGAPASFDAGTVADPHIVKRNGVYYVFYTCSPTNVKPWQTAYATSTDLVTFTKRGLILTDGPTGSWDDTCSFRGAISEFNGKYYFLYSGFHDATYQIGMAVMDVRPSVLI